MAITLVPGVQVITNIPDFKDSLSDRLNFIGSKQAILAKMDNTMMCIMNAVINQLCSTGASPVVPLNYAISRLQTSFANALSSDLEIPQIGLKCLIDINTPVFQLTQAFNIFQSMGNAVKNVLMNPIVGVVCLKPLFDKLGDLKLLLELFKLNLSVNMDAMIDNALNAIKSLLGSLLPDILGCKLL